MTWSGRESSDYLQASFHCSEDVQTTLIKRLLGGAMTPLLVKKKDSRPSVRAMETPSVEEPESFRRVRAEGNCSCYNGGCDIRYKL